VVCTLIEHHRHEAARSNRVGRCTARFAQQDVAAAGATTQFLTVVSACGLPCVLACTTLHTVVVHAQLLGDVLIVQEEGKCAEVQHKLHEAHKASCGRIREVVL
jgi:hypothetical protein